MFGTIKNLIGFGGNPSKTSVAFALGAHAKEILETLEDRFVAAAAPEEAAKVRFAFRRDQLLRGKDRLPLYLLCLSKGLCEEYDFEERAYPVLAILATAEYLGKEPDDAQLPVMNLLQKLYDIPDRYRQQMLQRPLILDSETVLFHLALMRIVAFAEILRENRKATLPIDKEFLDHIILGLSDKDVTDYPLILDETSDP